MDLPPTEIVWIGKTYILSKKPGKVNEFGLINYVATLSLFALQVFDTFDLHLLYDTYK